MRDTKSSLLFLVSFLLLVSFTLLCFLGYNYYQTLQADKAKTEVLLKTNDAQADATRDSLRKIYSATISQLDTRIDSTLNNTDSLKGHLEMKLNELDQLKNDIATILQTRGNNEDLELARQKINELQRKVSELRYRNSDVEEENKRLTALLEQLSNGVRNTEQVVRHTSYDNKVLTDKINALGAFTATDLRLEAVAMSNDKEEQTDAADQTEKLIGSFTVKNQIAQDGRGEMMIVVIQPNGQVLKNSAWETGSFETKDGKKIYSCKVKFDYNKGEAKRLLFSLSSDKYMKGNYSVQIYHNGRMVGRMSKTLS